jgi:predicted phage terminase large subunit-like protein
LSQEAWQNVLDQGLRRLAEDDVFAYGDYVYGLEPFDHHQEMVDFILEGLDAHEHRVILEPRGHAKTTWANTILLAWLIGRNAKRDLRIGLISNTAKQAAAFSRAIKFQLEGQRFQNVFGNRVGVSKWTDVEWIQKDSPLHATNNVTLYAQGALGAIVSKRFDIILCDDIIDAENCANIEQMEKVEDWFWMTLKPTLAPGGSIIVLGTRWGEDDLYQTLIEKKGWPSLVRGAIYEEDGVEHALWPEFWPLSKLYREKEDMGSAMFACSYLNDISGLMAGNVFRRDYFQYFDTLPEGKNYRIRMGVDLASSEKERADWTARCTVAEDEDFNHYVLSYYRDKRETNHASFVMDGWAAYPQMERVIIESQQFQSVLVQELLNNSSMPVVGRKADTDKVTRARAVAARYEGHKVFHHRSLKESDFETELLSFPKGHDDMVDALGYAMDLAGTRLVFGSVRR